LNDGFTQAEAAFDDKPVATAAHGVRREQHARDPRPHEPLDNDRHTDAMLLDAVPLPVVKCSLRPE
jgi:hypothetical protein